MCINVKMGVTSPGCHTRPACQPGSRFVFSLNHKNDVSLYHCVFFLTFGMRGVWGYFSWFATSRLSPGSTRSLKLCEKCGFNRCVRVFFIPWGHVNNHAQIWAIVTSISHMGQMRDSDWSRQNLLRSDWLLLIRATITTQLIRY